FFTDPERVSFADALRSTVYLSQRVSGLLPGRLKWLAARTDRLEVPAGEGWLAVGGAALASDPPASPGLPRALMSAAKAAEIVASDSARNPTSLREYCEFYSDHLKHFLRARHFFYGLENRWPDSPFWKRARQLRDSSQPA